MPVSTVFLVKDPPIDRLAALVEYLRVVSDEFIIVVDDRTSFEDITIMQSWPGVRIVPFEWCDDFAAARNAGLPYVTNEWVLHVDPDELPTFSMVEHIKEVTGPDAPEYPLAYIYWTPNWWGGVRGDDQPYHWHIRLWRAGRGKFYRRVHELVMLDGREEGMTRGSLAVHAPRHAYLIHSKPAERLVIDQDYYEYLGERSM